MIKKLKNLLMSMSIFSLLALPVLVPATVYADTTLGNKANCGASLNVDPDCNESPNEQGTTETINNIAKLIINIFSVIVGLISVIMIIVGGLKYITSGGESANVTGAKNTILYAIVGLVIVALAQLIVKFVLAKATNTTGA
jgi:hypothetical protein